LEERSYVTISERRLFDYRCNVRRSAVAGPLRRPEVFGGQGDDALTGGNGDDRLSGDLGNDSELGGNGNDILEGGNGDDFMFGDNGNDVVFGNQNNDTLVGGNGDDLIRGGQGDDDIEGDNGNDVIFGDLGSDTLLGSNGNDTFVFDSAAAGAATNPSPVGAAGDVILDFDVANGDTLHLQDSLHLGAAGNAQNFLNTGQSATTEGGAATIAASHMNGTVIYVTVNLNIGGVDDTLVFWDTNADGTPDEEIHLLSTPQALVRADDII